MKLQLSKEYLRSIFFGIEDSLVSTTGLLAGLTIGTNNKEFILLAGIIAITIESVSMGAGEYLSDEATSDFDKLKRHTSNPLISGFLMIVSYFFTGLIPLAPVLFFTFPVSLIVGVFLSMLALFALGYTKGAMLKTRPFRSGLKILLVGGLATSLGLAVGLFFGMQ